MSPLGAPVTSSDGGTGPSPSLPDSSGVGVQSGDAPEEHTQRAPREAGLYHEGDNAHQVWASGEVWTFHKGGHDYREDDQWHGLAKWRMTRIEHPDGQLDWYEGGPDEEAVVRIEYPDGFVGIYTGKRGERKLESMTRGPRPRGPRPLQLPPPSQGPPQPSVRELRRQRRAHEV